MVSVVDLYPDQMEVAPALVEKMSDDAGKYIEAAKKMVGDAKIPCETVVRMGGAPLRIHCSGSQGKECRPDCNGVTWAERA